jgi:hypothetical protein
MTARVASGEISNAVFLLSQASRNLERSECQRANVENMNVTLSKSASPSSIKVSDDTGQVLNDHSSGPSWEFDSSRVILPPRLPSTSLAFESTLVSPAELSLYGGGRQLDTPYSHGKSATFFGEAQQRLEDRNNGKSLSFTLNIDELIWVAP